MNQSQWRTTLYTVIIAFIIGGASGVLGTAWTSSYLSDYAVQLSELTTTLRLSQEKPRNLPSSYKEALEGFVETSLPSVVEIYQGGQDALGYHANDFSSIGVVLTTDGWMAVGMPDAATTLPAGAEARIGEQMYPIVEQIYDATTDVLFIRVDASELPVVAFGKGREARTGEQVFVATQTDQFVTASLSGHLWPDVVSVSSDEPNHFLQLDREVLPGSLVFNLSGDVIAFARSSQTLLPFEAIVPTLRSLLEKKEIIRPSLGVSYIDLAHAINIPETLTRSYRNGALLYGPTSITRTGAAKKAGVRVSDIIISVNGESVNGEHGLDELVEQYHVGDVVQLLVDREGKMQLIDVTLSQK